MHGRTPASNAALFHIRPDIGAIPGTNPRHEASRQLLRLARELTRVKDGGAMAAWLGAYNAWEMRHKDFLFVFN